MYRFFRLLVLPECDEDGKALAKAKKVVLMTKSVATGKKSEVDMMNSFLRRRPDILFNDGTHTRTHAQQQSRFPNGVRLTRGETSIACQR